MINDTYLGRMGENMWVLRYDTEYNPVHNRSFNCLVDSPSRRRRQRLPRYLTLFWKQTKAAGPRKIRSRISQAEYRKP